MLAKVCVIGHFGFGQELSNGQTIKTKTVTEGLERKLGKSEILKMDTHGGIKSLLRSPIQAFRALKKAKNVIIFPANNGLRVYAPLLVIFRRFFKKRKLHYVVIGGWLPEFIESRNFLQAFLKLFDGIYVETRTMQQALEKQGFTNIQVMPNCKDLEELNQSELVYTTEPPFRICTFSRVMKEKGIEDAVEAVRLVNEKYHKIVYRLDIYGQIDENQAQWFDSLQKRFPDGVRYRGIVKFSESVSTLKDYFLLLFPTYYEGEGFAGTVIDALTAGVPVIASDWKYNPEIVSDDVGIIFQHQNVTALSGILEKCFQNPESLNQMKANCTFKAKCYTTEKVIDDFIRNLE